MPHYIVYKIMLFEMVFTYQNRKIYVRWQLGIYSKNTNVFMKIYMLIIVEE